MVVMVWVLGFWWVVMICGGCGMGARFLVGGWVCGWVVIWNFFWDGDFMAMSCGGWFCWQWLCVVVVSGCSSCYCFQEERERDGKEEKEKEIDDELKKKEYLNEVVKK